MITLVPRGRLRTCTPSPLHRPCCWAPQAAPPRLGPHSPPPPPGGWSTAEMVAAAWWAEQLQASKASSPSLLLLGFPPQIPLRSPTPTLLPWKPSGTHLMGDLMQKDGHGGQEPNLQGRESVGFWAKGQAPTCPLSLQIFTLLGALAGRHVATRNTADKKPVFTELTVWRGRRGLNEHTKNHKITQ